MGSFTAKVYIVQRANGEVIGAKTAFGPAHELAKREAPAKVLFAVADKTGAVNVTDYDPDHRRAINCKSPD